MKTTRTSDAARCPACHAAATGASDVEGTRTPSPGDLTVCAYCSMVCVFNTDMTLRSASLDELDALPLDLRRKLLRYQVAAALASKRSGD